MYTPAQRQSCAMSELRAFDRWPDPRTTSPSRLRQPLMHQHAMLEDPDDTSTRFHGASLFHPLNVPSAPTSRPPPTSPNSRRTITRLRAQPPCLTPTAPSFAHHPNH